MTAPASPAQPGRHIVCIYCGAKQTHRVCDTCFDPQKVYAPPAPSRPYDGDQP